MTDKPLILEVRETGAAKAAKALDKVADSGDRVAASVDKAGGAADGSIPRFNKASAALGSFSKAAVAIGPAVLGAAAAVGVWIKSVVAMNDEMATLQANSGLTAETINALRLAADQADKALSEVVPKDLAKKMGELQRGSAEAADAFGQLGLSAADVANMSTDEALGTLLMRINDLPDPAKRAELAFRTMGQEGQNLLSTSLDSAEALQKMAAVGQLIATKTGPSAAEATSDWQQATFELATATEYLSNQFTGVISVAGSFVRLLTGSVIIAASQAEQIFARWNTAVENFTALIQGDFRTAWSGVVRLFGIVANDAFGLQTSLKKVDEILKALAPSSNKAGDGIKVLGTGLNQTADRSEKAASGVKSAAGAVKALSDNAALALPSLSSLQLELAKLQGDEANATFWQLDVDLARLDSTVEAITKAREKANDPAKVAEYNDALAVLAEQRVQLEQNASDRIVELTSAAAEVQEQAIADVSEKARTNYVGMAGSISSAFSGLTSSLLAEYDMQTEGGRRAARQAFENQKAANVGQILTSTLAGMTRQFVDLPFPAAMFTSTLIAASGALNAQQAAGQQMPAHHIGTRSTDEFPALLRAREAVLAPQAVDAAGGMAAVADLNAGVSQAPSGMAVVIDGRTAGYAVVRQMDQRQSQISGRMRRERTTRMGRRY